MSDLRTLTSDELGEVLSGKKEPGSVMWDENISVKYMADPHLKNAALKLMGFGNEEYDAEEIVKERWITLLRLEWGKRLEARKSSFKKG